MYKQAQFNVLVLVKITVVVALAVNFAEMRSRGLTIPCRVHREKDEFYASLW
jgi:hypothetical protein